MSVRTDTLKPSDLRKRWHQWTKMIESFARRNVKSRRIDVQSYRALYEGLLEACRCRMARPDIDANGLMHRLEELVKPWLTPDILARTDPEVLQNLLERCRKAEEELCGKSAGLSLAQWGAIAALSLVAVIILWCALIDAKALPILRQLQEGMEAIRAFFRQTTVVQRLFLIGALVAFGSILVVWRTNRA